MGSKSVSGGLGKKVRSPSVQECSNSKRFKEDTSHEVPRLRCRPPIDTPRNFIIPKEGTPVSDKIIKRAGPYLLGPRLGISPVNSIVQCLARKEGTDDFFLVKILTLKDEGQAETQDDRQGKMLLHTEYSLLSLLQDQEGVIHHHGLYKVPMFL